ncbi:2-oxoglutarate-dependent dioxygenase DAO-like [Andrographis paniculata]|uniref:2-oxoglutarate-dependent dioxygenase DAO-like n=1 Tax=Andrographis paniculata TaxID=175694 RepID=UPI0021E88B5F|nr:2-oxoglutarate-dependent dioxygenase DAO-like [Andrographis paniculata]
MLVFQLQLQNPQSEMGAPPIIDFDELQSELLPASEEWGCFRLTNHPIPAALMAEMKATVRCLLDLPPEIKARNKDVIAGSGYVPPGKANPLYEALGLYDVGSPQALHHFCSQLHLSPNQREIIQKYSEAIQELAIEIGQKLCKSLGLNLDLCKEWTCQFRINKYNFTRESVGLTGVQIHTDSGFLTILQDDECVGGLEVMDERSGEFIAVDPLPGSLVVNFGDTAKAWSNGRLCNVKHRVQCREPTTRISIALFVLGPKEGRVEAPVELVDVERGRLFCPFTVEDYRKLRLSTGLRAGEALELLRKESSSE